jgi:putative hydrolase of the HAD superfamily
VTGPGAVILDFGGVIWDMRWDVARALEAEHGLARGSVFSTLYRSAEWEAVQRGHGDRDRWRQAAHLALEAMAGRSLPAVHERWRQAGRPITPNVQLVRRLRGAYRVSVLSNADDTLRARLAGLGILDLFDDVVCSAEVGCAKPDPEIYALACRRLGHPPAACVFVDDHEPNVRAAEVAGLRALLYRLDRGDDLARRLAEAGVRAPAA